MRQHVFRLGGLYRLFEWTYVSSEYQIGMSGQFLMTSRQGLHEYS